MDLELHGPHNDALRGLCGFALQIQTLGRTVSAQPSQMVPSASMIFLNAKNICTLKFDFHAGY